MVVVGAVKEEQVAMTVEPVAVKEEQVEAPDQPGGQAAELEIELEEAQERSPYGPEEGRELEEEGGDSVVGSVVNVGPEFVVFVEAVAHI